MYTYSPVREFIKKTKYVWSFLKKKIVHTNLQLLYSCNFKCRICDFWQTSYQQLPKLSLIQIEQIASKLKQVGPQIISIGGGEPLMHKNIYEIIQRLATDNFPVMICNGWFVNQENAKALFRSGLYEASISVDYADPKKHDKQRGKDGAFDRAVAALKILNENRCYPHQRVHMISVILEDNIEDIEPLILLSKKMGVTYLVTLYSDSRGKKDTFLSSPDVSQYLMSLKNKYNNFVSLSGYLSNFTESIRNKNGISPCYAGKNLLNIDSQGNVTFCIDYLDNSVGNIIENKMEMIIRKLSKNCIQNNCGRCWTSCRGSVETLMYGKHKFRNMIDFYRMTKRQSVN